ncbi:TniQ family protein [Acinetobacter guillouiae]|uniref:TniQ family protein n=1 Tax=Acinetobacter guillouiae TaxID=106649 RepID=UPI002E2072C9
MTSVSNLLIHPIPYDGESAVSFLARLAELNRHSSIERLINKEQRHFLAKSAPNCRLADLPRFKYVLQLLNIDPNHQSLAFAKAGPTSRSARKWSNIELHEDLLKYYPCSYCPQCLEEQPFFKKNWLLQPLYACPIHSIFLVDKCYQCGSSISLSSGVTKCRHCHALLQDAPKIECSSIRAIRWFVETLNHDSNDFFQYFTAFWLAIRGFFELDNVIDNETTLELIYEYFNNRNQSIIRLSTLINQRINLAHPRIQLLPFLKHSRFFKNYAALVEAKCHTYTPSDKSHIVGVKKRELQLVLGVTHNTLEDWIEQDFLKLGDINHYYDVIPSQSIEKFLILNRNKNLLRKPRTKEIHLHPKQLDLKEISNILDINYETARKLANTGWFDLDRLSNDAKAAEGYSFTKLESFKSEYILVSTIAKKLDINPTNLVEKLASIGIVPIRGPHIDASPLNIYLMSSVNHLRKSDLEKIIQYPTLTGRPKKSVTPLKTKQDFFSLNEAAEHLNISPNKVSVLIKKGILVKDTNYPLSIKIPKVSVLRLKHKLLSENSISTKQAAKLLNCSVNWLGEYWCKSGFLTVENLVYWKLVQQKDVDEVLKLKETYMTGAEASKLLGMPHSHITNLQTQGLIQPIYLGTGSPIRLFKRSDVQCMKNRNP